MGESFFAMDWMNGPWTPSPEVKLVSPKPCRYLMSSRGCHFGENCRFSHQALICERLKVPPQTIGALIGKQGMTRRRIESESGIDIMTVLSTSSEVVIAAYDRERVTHAVSLVQEIIDEFGKKNERKEEEQRKKRNRYSRVKTK